MKEFTNSSLQSSLFYVGAVHKKVLIVFAFCLPFDTRALIRATSIFFKLHLLQFKSEAESITQSVTRSNKIKKNFLRVIVDNFLSSCFSISAVSSRGVIFQLVDFILTVKSMSKCLHFTTFSNVLFFFRFFFVRLRSRKKNRVNSLKMKLFAILFQV
jgi:hypothetical protein